MKHCCIVTYGNAGSGKGTLLKKGLKPELGGHILGMGDHLRRHIKAETPFGKVVAPYVKKGELVPDLESNCAFLNMFEKLHPDDQPLWLLYLDGVTRTASQTATVVDKLRRTGYDTVYGLVIDTPTKVCRERLIARAYSEGRDDDQCLEAIEQRLMDCERHYEAVVRGFYTFTDGVYQFPVTEMREEAPGIVQVMCTVMENTLRPRRSQCEQFGDQYSRRDNVHAFVEETGRLQMAKNDPARRFVRPGYDQRWQAWDSTAVA